MVSWYHQPGEFQPIRVMAHAGYRGAQYPQRIAQADGEFAIDTVLSHWREPDFEYFGVRLENGVRVLLRHSLDGDDWALKTGI